MSSEQAGIRGGAACDDLFDASLLYNLDFSRAACQMKNGLCPSNAGDGLVLRPLRIGDYQRGKPVVVWPSLCAVDDMCW